MCRIFAVMAAWAILATPAQASLGHDTNPEDNISACRPSVREGIENLRKTYKDIHFTCKDGFVIELVAPPQPGLFYGNSSDFIERNWVIFLPSAPKRPLEFKGSEQIFAGFKVHGGSVRVDHRRSLRGKGEHYTQYRVTVFDTSNWEAPPKARIDGFKADELAQRYHQKRHPQVKWDYIHSLDPVLVVTDRDVQPRLSWKVAVYAHGEFPAGMPGLLVDATNGEVRQK